MDIMTSAIISILTWLVSFLVYRHNTNKDKSSLILEMNKTISNARDNKLVIEYLFSVIYGVKGTDCSDIELLVKHPSPQKAILNYLTVQRYIHAFTLLNDSGSIRIVIEERWKRGWKRTINQTGFLAAIAMMYWLTTIFSDISYGYFASIYNSTFSSVIKNSGLINFIMDVFVNIAIPVMFSIVGYMSFRSFYSSMMIDVTAKFLDPAYTHDNNNSGFRTMLKSLKRNAATIIATLALLATCSQLWQQRDFYKTSLRPQITAYYSIDGRSETKRNGIYFYNGGLGNAIVHKTLVTIDGNPVKKSNFGDFYSAINMLGLDAGCFLYATPRQNDFLIRDKETFFIEANESAKGLCGLSQTILSLKEQLLQNERFNFRIQFTSAYGEKFTYDYRKNTQSEGWN